ncbi:MAG: N-acetyltransferase family protein [Alphaproteobacteria bacterium]|nr:MAG: N-acetyltransferase family protein [Alphaproteobacteria bacterium]
MNTGAPSAAIVVRDAAASDIPHIQAIYAHHVRHGLASFEEIPPDVAEMMRRFEAITTRNLPYLVAEITEPATAAPVVQGYAYAGPYRTRPGYRFTVENSIYVAPGGQRRGLGRALLEALIRRCTAAGYRQMVAVIGDSANVASIRLHESFGFERVGVLRSVGFKFGRWVDSVLLQRPLGEGDATLPAAPPTGWRG